MASFKATLGEVFYNRWEDPVYLCIYVAKTKERLDQVNPSVFHQHGWNYDPEEISEWIEEYPDEDGFISEYGEIESYDRMTEDRHLVGEQQREIATARFDKVKTALESIKGLDLNNLIVSDGAVYSGYDECANYIQGTYAWCSSSMEC